MVKIPYDLPTQCVMGCNIDTDPAVAIYYLDRGCVALRNTTVQPLCWHHENVATPIRNMEIIKDLRL